jgi:AraC family transcriptional regulator
LLSSETAAPDPLRAALERKAGTGAPGASMPTMLASGDGWRAVDIVCTHGPGDGAVEERFGGVSVSLVLSGTFVYRSDRGSSLMSPGALLLGDAGRAYEISHEHGEGDRCLSFQFDPDVFERVASDVGASRGVLGRHRLPPLRALAPHTARASAALGREDSFEEIAFALAGAVIGIVADVRGGDGGATAADRERVARVLGAMQSDHARAYPLAGLARIAGLSRYHFLRTFARVTGVTPHQWLLRARLRDAAERLVTSSAPVTEIALDAGFDDLSNFVRTFRAEFGVPPRRYRSMA